MPPYLQNEGIPEPTTSCLPEEQRVAMLDRLKQVCVVSDALGYGVADEMEELLADFR